MDRIVTPMNIKDHGVTIDQKKQRVQCNYCEKVISGFYRLKFHLGGIRGDVKPCDKVPDDVKENMRDLVNKKKAGIVRKTKKRQSFANLQREKRTPSPNAGNSADQKRTKLASCDLNLGMTIDGPFINFASTSTGKLNKETATHSEVKRDSSTQEAQESTVRFFDKTGTSKNAPNLSSFQRMMSSIIAQPQIETLPSYKDQRDWNFEKNMEQMLAYVNEIKKSWEVTGCTILLEPWFDEKGQTLMIVLADCLKGPIYLRSYDLSSCVGDDYAMQKLIDRIVKKVGEANVVQILIDSLEPTCMFGVEKSKYKGLFRSPSASYCLEIILKRMAESPSIRCTLKHAKIIMRFIYRNTIVFNQMKDQINSRNYLLSTSRYKFVNPFLTLENMLANKKNLKAMIKSYERHSSTKEAKEVRFLVKGEFFWRDANMAFMVASPIMKILCTLNSSAKPQISYIYEEMDRGKEEIKKILENLEEDQDLYEDFWKLIDKVWDDHMHTPLHAAACHLNPHYHTLYDCAKIDREIESGFKKTVRCMVQDQYYRDQIFQQVDRHYQNSSSCFNNGHMIAGEEKLSPAEWWSVHGNQCPQLAKFATRVVSQTCVGASRYGLKKSMAEKELKARSETSARSGLEEKELKSRSNKTALQRRQIDEAFVYYNLQLHNYKANRRFLVSETPEVDPTTEWIFQNE